MRRFYLTTTLNLLYILYLMIVRSAFDHVSYRNIVCYQKRYAAVRMVRSTNKLKLQKRSFYSQNLITQLCSSNTLNLRLLRRLPRKFSTKYFAPNHIFCCLSLLNSPSQITLPCLYENNRDEIIEISIYHRLFHSCITNNDS